MGKRPFHLGPDKEEPGSRTGQATAELDVADAGRYTIQQVATIGRAPDSHIVLDVRSVSRHHARIFYEGGHFWLKDLDSGNGTTVNGKRVKLQMLSDEDRVCFGEAKAVFRTGARSLAGPAPLGRDPLEGSDVSQDGTPTGGLRGFYPDVTPDDRTGPAVRAASETLSTPPRETGEAAAALKARIEKLERDNAELRQEIAQLRSSDPAKETERLRRLVAQLERALADSNIRIRNLQERLGG